VRFVVVGNDAPAQAVLELLLAEPRAAIAALVGSSTGANRAAAERGIPVEDVAGLPAEGVNDRVLAVDADWLISANSTVVLRSDVLARFPGRALNLHPGLLPEYAGLHVHQWAIRNGEDEFGATVHLLEAAVDAGDVVAERRFPIAPEDTGLSLFTRCMRAGTELLVGVLETVLRGGELARTPQDLSRRRLYRHRDALDGRIDWSLPARSVVDFVRAGNYEPFASPTYTAEAGELRGEPLRILRAAAAPGSPSAMPGTVIEIGADGPVVACGEGAVTLTRARSGRALVDEAAWREHVSSLPGARLPGREA
jgi:methionyl-tRNA formyltransferase